MKIIATSDLHGHLPVNVPECDLLLIAGDICPLARPHAQAQWLRWEFRQWLDAVPAKHIVGIAGNHDWPFENKRLELPKMRWHYLQDSGVTIEGVKIWGTPWQPRFYDWAFNLDEPELATKFAMIPDDTNILITHGPPYGIGDRTREGTPAGSPSLLRRIEAAQPKIHVFGHIHEGYGEYRVNGTRCINASFVNREYQPTNGLVELGW